MERIKKGDTVQVIGGADASDARREGKKVEGTVQRVIRGWRVDRFRRRRETFIFACILFTLTWGLMSRATTWQQLTALNVLAGFCFGMCTNMIVIMTGLLSTPGG